MVFSKSCAVKYYSSAFVLKLSLAVQWREASLSPCALVLTKLIKTWPRTYTGIVHIHRVESTLANYLQTGCSKTGIKY